MRQNDLKGAVLRFNEALTIAANMPDTCEAGGLVAQSLRDLAELYRKEGNVAQAARYYERCLKTLEKVYGADSQRIDPVLCRLLEIREQEGNQAECEALLQKLIAVRKRALPEDSPLLSDMLDRLAWIYLRQGDVMKAEAVYSKDKAQSGAGRSDEEKADLIAPLRLSCLCLKRGKVSQAEELFARSEGSAAKLEKFEDPRYLRALIDLEQQCLRQGLIWGENVYRCLLKSLKKADSSALVEVVGPVDDLCKTLFAYKFFERYEQIMRYYLAGQRALAGRDNLETVKALDSLADVLIHLNRPAEAVQCASQALAIRKKYPKASFDISLRDLTILSKSFLKNKDVKSAFLLIEDALAGDPKVKVNDMGIVWDALFSVGNECFQAGYYDETEKIFKHTIAILLNNEAADDYRVGISFYYIGMSKKNQKKFAEAESFFRKALPIESKFLGPNNAETDNTLAPLAECLFNQGKMAEAERALKTCLAVALTDEKPTGYYYRGYSYHWLVKVCQQEGKTDEANSYQKLLNELRKKRPDVKW